MVMLKSKQQYFQSLKSERIFKFIDFSFKILFDLRFEAIILQ